MTGTTNDDFIRCWTEILVPKWIRFRHVLSGNGAIHSRRAYEYFDLQPGDNVLDVGCGFGETSIEIGELVGFSGNVVGLDCTQAFLDLAEEERIAAGADNVEFICGDAQFIDLGTRDYFDVIHSRFGVMFFASAVAALRNCSKALRPGGKLCLIVWRNLSENPAWHCGKNVALKYLPEPGDDKETCGPGPFSWGGPNTDRAMLEAAGFPDIEVFERIDAEIFMGRTLEEAIDFQILVGPSGEIIREAGPLAEPVLPKIRADLAEYLTPHLREDGVYLPSSSWAIVARKPG